jgi:hypothetical protein
VQRHIAVQLLLAVQFQKQYSCRCWCSFGSSTEPQLLRVRTAGRIGATLSHDSTAVDVGAVLQSSTRPQLLQVRTAGRVDSTAAARGTSAVDSTAAHSSTDAGGGAAALTTTKPQFQQVSAVG